MDPTTDTRLQATLAELPYPLLFATLSGARLYGFPCLIPTLTCAASTWRRYRN
jgi:hypothetical protein